MRDLAHLINGATNGAINGVIVAWVLFCVGVGLVLVLPEFILRLIMGVVLLVGLCCVPMAIYDAFRFFIRGY